MYKKTLFLLMILVLLAACTAAGKSLQTAAAPVSEAPAAQVAASRRAVT